MARVVSTETAQESIARMQQIVNGGLVQEIHNLNREGQILCDPNNWDGNLAYQFRVEVWPQVKSTLDKALIEIEQLRQKISQINSDIMTAGGNI